MMQHARIYNSTSNPLLKKTVSSSSSNQNETSPVIKPASVQRNSGNQVMNRNVGSTITIGRKSQYQHRQLLNSNLTPSTTRASVRSSSISDLPNSPVINPVVDPSQPTQLTVWFHELRTSSEDLIIDANSIPGGVKLGLVYELQLLESNTPKKLYFAVNPKNFRESDEKINEQSPILEPVAQINKSKFQISLISNPLQKLLDIPPRSLVQIKRVTDLNPIEADTVEVHVKDINLARDTMWNFSSTLVNTCVYSQKRLSFLNNRTGVVKYVYKNGKTIFSGYVSENTKVVFRSESAKLVVLVQLSREMWHFEENGEIMFHKLVNNLFPKIFKRWINKGTHHSITIVLFTSVDLTDIPWTTLREGERPNNRRDYFRVVVDQVSVLTWDKIMANLRLEFANFKRDIMLKSLDGTFAMEGEPLPSVKGNVLEALNLGLTLVNNRFRNTDLKHSLTHFILVTAGTGIFDVDYNLMLETSKKMLMIDSGLDVVSLSQPPLHIVPLFRFNHEGKTTNCVPNWCDISFYKDLNHDDKQWIPHCKIYELQMMGVMENEVNEVRIDRFQINKKAKNMIEAMDNYDRDVFKPVNNQVDEEPEITDYTIKGLNLSKSKPSIPKNSYATLALIFNKKTTLAPLSSASRSNVTTNTLAQGTVTQNNGELSALSSLYTLNKFSDEKTASSATSLRSSNSFATLRAPEVIRKDTYSPRILDSEKIFKKDPSKPKAPRQPKKPVKKRLRNRKLSSITSDGEEKDSVTDLMWVEIENPSMQIQSEVTARTIDGRWNHVFPVGAKRTLIKWKSFQSPAALPITTSEFPSRKRLETEFMFQNYMILLNYENYLELTSAHELMKEMIQLRLLAGFQICYGEKVKKAELERKQGGNPDSILKYYPENTALGSIMYLSFYDEIHRISCDYNGNIYVQLYKKTPTSEANKITLGHHGPKTYSPLIRTRYADEYSPAKIDAIEQKPQKFNWNQFDQYLAGYEDAIPDANQDFHMMKFVVMPTEIPKNAYFVTNELLSDEEIRVEGLRKLIALMEKGKYISHGESKQNDPTYPEIIFYTGNLYDFLDEEAENYNITGNQPTLMIPESMRFNKSIKLAELAEELQSPTGLKLVDRTWHFKRHLHCFVGTELVSWLLECFEDIDTREAATAYGQSLMNKGLFKHVEARHGLLDGYYFYEFEEEYIDKSYVESKLTWFGKKKVIEKQDPPTPTTPTFTRNNSDNESVSSHISRQETDLRKVISNNLMDSDISSIGGSSTRARGRRKKFILSKAVKFDVDPTKKSSRPEIMTVHYDRVHNPEHCYHIRLQWLNTTTRFIDETITSWSRLCDRHGLKLVETPWNELCTIPQVNPFHSFVELKLEVNPWLDNEFVDSRILKENKFYYHLYLLKKCDFLLDNRSTIFFLKDNIEISYSWGKPTFQYAQYIHKTGSYFVELRDNGEFFLAPNNLHITRLNTALTTIPDHELNLKTYHLDSQRVMLNFRSACQNEPLLRKIFREAKANWREELKGETILTTA